MMDEDLLTEVEFKHNNDLVSGWIFAYRAYKNGAADLIKYLMENFNHSNPRVREQVCDIVGDEQIIALRSKLLDLFDDPVTYVAEAAKYNYEEMF